MLAPILPKRQIEDGHNIPTDAEVAAASGATGNTVFKTGDQTIDDVKTFTSSPLIPGNASGGEAINSAEVSQRIQTLADTFLANGQIPAGTSFPSTAENNVLFKRTDLDRVFIRSNAQWVEFN